MKRTSRLPSKPSEMIMDVDGSTAMFPLGQRMLDDRDDIHMASPRSWSNTVQKDYDAINSGTLDAVNSAWANALLVEWGLTPAKINGMKKKERMKICDKLVRAARKTQAKKHDDILISLLAQPKRPWTLPGGAIETGDLNSKYRGGVPREIIEMNRTHEGQKQRAELHRALRVWAAGPLALEHPQSSSYHHLVEYDRQWSPGSWALGEQDEKPELFVVERDWARAFAGYELTEGEAPMPFPYCVFEFRVTGVRVLAFYKGDVMFCVYGRGGLWVCDDYLYDRESGRKQPISQDLDLHEFPRVSKLIRDNVRVACIMVDADLARREHVPVSRKLVERRVDEGRAAPRSHYVIDLKRQRHASHGATGGGVSGVKQRGHFRRGTWVHYDDLDSGAVQYADSGGFWHSRTWRAWHFAGDPNNLVEKEYRL